MPPTVLFEGVNWIVPDLNVLDLLPEDREMAMKKFNSCFQVLFPTRQIIHYGEYLVLWMTFNVSQET